MAGNAKPARPLAADPYLSYLFKVEIDSRVVAAFAEASGLAVEAEVETFREGGFNSSERQLAGPAKYPGRLVLKRGLADEQVLWPWCRQVMRGEIARKDVSILLLDAAGDERCRWDFSKACPVKWTGPELRAQASEIAFESVEFVHEGLQQLA